MIIRSFSWQTVPLGDLCDIDIGRTPSRIVSKYWGTGFPWLSIADMEQGRQIRTTKETITQQAVDECNCRLVPAGTLLMSFKLSLGKVAFANIPIYTNEAIASLPVKDAKRLLPDFLYWALQVIDLEENTDRAVKGATLNKAKLKELRIPLPPLPEQKRIAAILDKANVIRQKRQRTIQFADHFLRASFLSMFGEPTNNRKNWSREPLESFCSDIVDCPHSTPRYSKERSLYPCIRSSDLQDGRLVLETSKYVDEDVYRDRIARMKPEPGDIIYCREGARLGNLALVPEGLTPCLGQRTMLFRINPDETTPFFLLSLLNSEGIRNQITEKIIGAAAPRINVKELKELMIIKPPLLLQRKYEEIARKQVLLRDRYQSHLLLSNQAFKSLTQRAFREEL